VEEDSAAPTWQTLGAYLNSGSSPNRQFLKTFTHLEWRQYSALSHGAYEAFIGHLGDLPVGAYYFIDFLQHADRPKVEATYDLFMSKHIRRAATVLLSLITEIQAHCLFDSANINERICSIWLALIPLFESKEIYDARYDRLMREKAISQGF
jgi:hypothetical protein